MPGLLIKNVPAALHNKLKKDAERNHRSLTKHALALLEEAVSGHPKPRLPTPYRGKTPLSQRMLSKALREGRE